MTRKTNRNILYSYAISKFLPKSRFKWIGPKEFDLSKYTSNSPKGCILEFDLEYPSEIKDLHNDCPLTPDKIEIKREVLSEYQLKVANLYNISIVNVKKLVPNFCDKKIYVLYHENLQLYFILGLKLRNIDI